MEKYRKTGGPLKCKQCVQADAAAEREAAAQKRAASSDRHESTTAISTETRECAKCQQFLGFDQYNRNQWNKGQGKSKCRTCVEASLQQEQNQQEQAKAEKLVAARVKLEAATTPAERVAAESEIAALEAQKVTGLQPVKLGRGRGGGGRAGRGGGRGGRAGGRGRK